MDTNLENRKECDLNGFCCYKKYYKEAEKAIEEAKMVFQKNDNKKKVVLKIPYSCDEFVVTVKTIGMLKYDYYIERVWWSKKRIRLWQKFPYLESMGIGF